jgi:hypothetical protein
MALLDTFCGSPCHRPTGAIFNGRTDNCDAFIAVHPDAINVLASGGPSTFFQNMLHIACGVDRKNIRPCVEWLLAKGAKPLLRERMGVGATPFGCLVHNEDADLTVLKTLADADPEWAKEDLNAYVKPKKMVWAMWHIMGGLSIVSRNAGLMHKMMREFLLVGTMLHWACMLGNVPMIAALLDLGADPTIRTLPCTKHPLAKGVTPYELLCHLFPESAAPAAMAALLHAKGYAHLVTGAKLLAQRSTLAKAKMGKVVNTVKALHVVPPARVLPAAAQATPADA